jgi:hypothetical protein
MQKLPYKLVADLLEQGWGPTKIALHLQEHYGIDVTPNAISMFRRRATDVPPMHSTKRLLPWHIHREHENSVYRHAILAWHQRERGEPLSPERDRNLRSVETRLLENGLVIDYAPNRGFFTVAARPGIDMGLVREVDRVPRPPTKGPYSLPGAHPNSRPQPPLGAGTEHSDSPDISSATGHPRSGGDHEVSEWVIEHNAGPPPPPRGSRSGHRD